MVRQDSRARSDRAWRSDVLLTRGEFLIRKGGRVRPRRVAAVLELVKPYLAVLKCEAAQHAMEPTRAGRLSAAAHRDDIRPNQYPACT